MTVKILVGGFPCTKFSIAQKNDRETLPYSGEGWELFYNALLAKEKFKPDFFMFENNYSMAKPIKKEIDKLLGIEHIVINAALVSAQNRKRCYWTNIPGVEQPEDRGILLRDILETGDNLSPTDKAYCLTASYDGACAWNTLERSQRTMVAEPVALNTTTDGKAQCLRATYYKDGIRNMVGNDVDKRTCVAEPVCMCYKRSEEAKRLRKQYETGEIHHGFNELNELQPRTDGKTNTLSTVLKDNPICEPVRIGTMPSNIKNKKHDSKQYRIYSVDGKSTSLCASPGSLGKMTGLYAIPVEFENNVPVKAVSCADGKTYTVYCVINGKITIKEKEYDIKLLDGYYIIRKLTVTECCRLQGMPDWWFLDDEGKQLISNTQCYKGLGNGWQKDTVQHIMSYLPVDKNEKIVLLSLYDGIGTAMKILEDLGYKNVLYIAYEIDKYCIKVTQYRYPNVIHMGDCFDIRKDGWLDEIKRICKEHGYEW